MSHPLEVFRSQTTPFPPEPPSWRPYREFPSERLAEVRRDPPRLGPSEIRRAKTYVPSGIEEDPDHGEEYDVIKAALALRRPILLMGPPGVGKSTLAYVAAHFLGLGKVLTWQVTSSTTLEEGLYDYDAIGRLQHFNAIPPMLQAGGQLEIRAKELLARESKAEAEGRFYRLGPLGTALLPADQPRVLLIDELDKSDADLPSDLLHILEAGRFEIPELKRLPPELRNMRVRPADARGDETVPIADGEVICYEFPLIFVTSNRERDFPRAFKRRCLRWTVDFPKKPQLSRIVKSHFENADPGEVVNAVDRFQARLDQDSEHAVDQLLNMFFLRSQTGMSLDQAEKTALKNQGLRET